MVICSAFVFAFVAGGSFLLRLSPDVVPRLLQLDSKQSQIQQAKPLTNQPVAVSALGAFKEEAAIRNLRHKWQNIKVKLAKEHDYGSSYLHAAEQVLTLTKQAAAGRRSIFGEEVRPNKSVGRSSQLSAQENAENRDIAYALIDLAKAEVFNDALLSAQKHLIEGIALLGDDMEKVFPKLHGTNNSYLFGANSYLAYCFIRQGHYDDAITAASKALEFSPDHIGNTTSFVLRVRARAYAHLKQNGLALKDYRKVLNAADTSAQKATISDEMEYLESQKVGGGSSSIEVQLTQCREQLEGYEKLNDRLLTESQKLLQLTMNAHRSPKEIAVAHYYLGLAQTKNGDDQSAINNFEHALQIFNSDCRREDVKYWLPTTQYNLARSYYKQRRYKESYKYASEALDHSSLTSADKALDIALQSAAKSKLQHTDSSRRR
jgi:tetratricopeptide (TPR) repeat protein